MVITETTPAVDDFRMPAEYELHHGTIMIWPVRPGSWPFEGKAAKKIFSRLAACIAEYEHIYMLADKEHLNEAEEMLHAAVAELYGCDSDKLEGIFENIHVWNIESDDSWARDVGPTFTISSHPCQLRGINWKFNAWGGEVDGLYASWERDDAVASAFCESLKVDYYDASDFVLEGGSIHVDGEGTAIVTESCLLSAGRNPGLNKKQIEDKLKEYLNVSKVIWLPYGIYNDETNEHVDNVCAFTSPGNVVLAWTDKKDDPQYMMSAADLEVLQKETDAKGRAINIHKLYIPDIPVTVKETDLLGYEFEEGEDARVAGERLAASYVNFYIANKKVLVPQFNDIMDEKALAELRECFPDREVIGVYARDIIVGGGNIHCITQQIPYYEK